jgi:hypothetical protein
VENTSEILNKSVEWSISGAVKIAFVPGSQTVMPQTLAPGRLPHRSNRTRTVAFLLAVYGVAGFQTADDRCE